MIQNEDKIYVIYIAIIIVNEIHSLKKKTFENKTVQ